MSIMKLKSMQLLLVFSLLSCLSMKAQDRLGTCIDNSNYQLLSDYDDVFDTIIRNRLCDDYLVRCVYLPSFDSKWVLQIEENSLSGCYQITTLSFNRHLWFHNNETIGISMDLMTIEKEIVLDLINLVSLFIENKTDFLVMGCMTDGETIQFKVKILNEIQCGTTSCPDETSLTGRLVDVFNKLRITVINGTMDQDLFASIKSLLEDTSYHYSIDNCRDEN